jgi:hypothetical protein
LTFHFDRKKEKLGSVEVDQWWMPITRLYGQRQRGGRPENREAILAAFWELAKQAGTHTDPEVGESYLLGRLVPFVRSDGSRRVFRDAFIRNKRGGRSARVEELDALIRAGSQLAIDELEFHRRSADILGPPTLPREAAAEYTRMAADLLGPARDLLPIDEAQAVTSVERTWNDWMNSIARRSGNVTAKQVLDILSYEARAALHRAYSAVWSEALLPWLRMKHRLSSASVEFLTFWHTDPCREAADASGYFHVFHGHVFGLHPAGAAFICTPAGCELLGDWLAEPEPDVSDDYGSWSRAINGADSRAAHRERGRCSYRRLLNGILVAVYEYERRLCDANFDRRR